MPPLCFRYSTCRLIFPVLLWLTWSLIRRRDLLWPIPDTHRLAVVVRAIERMGGSLELLDLSALGKLSESESVQLVTALSQLKAGALKELIMPCLTPFKTVTKLLETLTSLERLDLSKNTLGDEGAVELASVLGELCALRRLDLGGKNNIGGDGCKALAGALVGLQHLGTQFTALLVQTYKY